MKQKLTKQMKEALKVYFNLRQSNPNFTYAKVNFIKKWGMSPGYMTLMYK